MYVTRSWHRHAKRGRVVKLGFFLFCFNLSHSAAYARAEERVLRRE